MQRALRLTGFAPYSEAHHAKQSRRIRSRGLRRILTPRILTQHLGQYERPDAILGTLGYRLTPEFWLALQTRYDLEEAEDKLASVVRQIKPKSGAKTRQKAIA
jgi:hypothetical protein